MTISPYSPLNRNECQRARMARDARFDGKFYVAVKSTGIFCRPICPANLPREENVEYFIHPAQALQAGYRPCLRCRPDSAPESHAWKGAKTTFLRAIKLIDQGELQDSNLAELALRLGISDRYLRQLFHQHLGLSPKQYAQYQQLMFAKQLLHNSTMSVTDIGYACGFNSTRRFNDAFRKILKLTPTRLRKKTRQTAPANRLTLAFNPPFDWQHMLDFYRRRAIKGMEAVGSKHYERFFLLNGKRGWFKASFDSPDHIQVEFEISEITQLKHLVTRLRRMLDLDANITIIENHLQNIAPGLIHSSGIRIPGVWDSWEAGIRAILGQQVSIKAAIGHLNSLVAHLNPDANGNAVYFPTPEQIAHSDLGFLRMPQQRQQTLKNLARHFIRHGNEHDPGDWLDIKGIGPWTVNYARLRGRSEPDCFLEGDLIVKKIMPHFPELSSNSASPWGSYATFHSWNYQS